MAWQSHHNNSLCFQRQCDITKAIFLPSLLSVSFFLFRIPQVFLRGVKWAKGYESLLTLCFPFCAFILFSFTVFLCISFSFFLCVGLNLIRTGCKLFREACWIKAFDCQFYCLACCIIENPSISVYHHDGVLQRYVPSPSKETPSFTPAHRLSSALLHSVHICDWSSRSPAGSCMRSIVCADIFTSQPGRANFMSCSY